MSHPVPHSGILDIKPYIGGEAKATAARLYRLASNENPLGPSPKAIAAYKNLAGELHRYPDGTAMALREAIGQVHGLAPSRIVCGAGSDELLGLLVKAYMGAGDELIYSQHGFLMYPIMARIAGGVPVVAAEQNLRADPEAILAAITPRTKIIMLANPNNPTGSFLTSKEVKALQAQIPKHVLLVLDSAYAEYVQHSDYSAGHELVDACENVVMTRTFSKIYGLAALRLGWCYGPANVIDVLERVRDPFNTNAPAIAAGCAAIQDVEFVERSRDITNRMRPWLSERLFNMGFHVYPSLANFILASFKPCDAEAIRLFLKERGVLIRQMGAYGLPDCLRITIGEEDDMQAVIDGIHAFLNAQKS